MELNLVSSRGVVLLVLAAVTVALGLGLAHTPANRAANRWLAAYLLVLACVAFDYTIELARLDREWRWLRHLPLGVTMALGPLLFGYLHRLTSGRAPSRAWLHFLPAGLQGLYLAGVFFAPESVRAPLTDGRARGPLDQALQVALPLSLAAYAAAGLVLMGRYRTRALQARSDVDQFAARWVRNVLVVLVLSAAGEALVRAAVLAGRRVDVFDVYPFHVWLLATGAYLGVEARRFLERPFPAMGVVVASEPVPAPDKDWRSMGVEWRARTWEAAWWREPNLTLADLARRLGVNSSYLSRGINEGLGQNFSEMINGMRAEAVARELERGGTGRDMLELSLDAGFGSKSSFNRAFRARFGMTPTRFRAQARVRS